MKSLSVKFIAASIWLLAAGMMMVESASAQERELRSDAYFGIQGASGQTPFWHYANIYGRIPDRSAFNTLAGGSVHAPRFVSWKGFNLSAGVHTFGRISDVNNSLHFQELYFKIDFAGFQAMVGRFRDDAEILAPDFSSGSMMISRNATPVPRLLFGTDGYKDIPFTSGHLQFKAIYSDGVLESNRHISNAMMHHKSLHLKMNILVFEIMTGFIHNVQWGGTDPERGRLPMGFDDYLRVVLGRSADQASGATEFEVTNRLGNTIAAYDGEMIVHLGKHQILAYRQIYLEDTLSMALRSYLAGLFGLGYRNAANDSWLNLALLEYVNTIRQDSFRNAPKGRANYYNHYVYLSGWAYHGSAIGNPLLTYDSEQHLFTNNMILGWHFAFAGNITDDLSYILKFTYTRNYGVCEDQIIEGKCHITSSELQDVGLVLIPRHELRKDQYSLLIQLDYNLPRMPGVKLHGSAGIDTGDHLGNRLGIMLGVTFTDFLAGN